MMKYSRSMNFLKFYLCISLHFAVFIHLLRSCATTIKIFIMTGSGMVISHPGEYE